MTNADKIRSMTDEELAEYLDGICHDLWQMFVKDPQKMWLDWLKKEKEEPKQLSYDGLAHISPTDVIGTTEYYIDQIKSMPTIIEAEE